MTPCIYRLPAVLTAAFAAAFFFFFAGPAAAQEGSVTGQVTALTSGEPLNGVQIVVEGTGRGVLTNADGRFLIMRVPAGTYRVRVVSLGWATANREVTVTAGEAARIDFQLERSTIDLDEIVVTGTAGQVERRKIGVSLGSVDVSEIQERVPLADFSHVLEGRIPGVRSIGVVGGVGATKDLRIRGFDSFSLSQRPLVYIDGVRVDNYGGEWGWMGGATCCAFSGGAGEDRLSDLNPDEIERIEVLKGPAAATLYGSEASGGVIQVFTKRGRNNSPANFSFATSVGLNRHRPNFPTTLRSNFEGQDGTVPLDPNETLIENGLIHSYDLTVDGGGENITYFVAGGYSYEQGSVQPNDQKKGNLRVNLNWTAGENLTVGVSSGYSRNRILSLQSGNNWLGIYTNALLSRPFNATADEPYGGGLDVSVEDAKAIDTFSDADRWTGSLTLNYTPSQDFTHRLTFGVDALNDQKTRTLPFGRHYTYIGEQGERNIGYRTSRNFTGEYLGNLSYENAVGFITGTLAFGGQGYWRTENRSMATGRGFAGKGVTTVSGAAITEAGESFSEEINLGAFVQNRFDVTDNLFLSAALRMDGNSAFGKNFGFQFYPKADVAYNFGAGTLPGFISSAKLRAAYGLAGKAPGPFAQFRTFQPNTVLADLAGVRPLNPGNADLEPENKREYEIGADLGFLDNRLGLQATYWDAVTTNALLGISLPPSQGFSEARVENVGKILNRGVELGVDAAIIDTEAFRWDANLNYEWIHNEILDLGETAQLDSLPIYEGTEIVRWEHYHRLGGLWEGLPTQEIISRGVVGWDAEKREHIRSTFGFFRGQDFPDQLGSISNNFSFFDAFNLTVMFRGEWGHSMVNSDRSYGVRQFAYDEYLKHLNPDGTPTPAADSVLNFMRLASPVDRRDNIRLQEVSLSWRIPASLSSAVGLQRSRLTLSGYNLHWWDNCNCPDPNQQYSGGDDFNQSPFLALPQPRRFLLSFRTRF